MNAFNFCIRLMTQKLFFSVFLHRFFFFYSAKLFFCDYVVKSILQRSEENSIGWISIENFITKMYGFEEYSSGFFLLFIQNSFFLRRSSETRRQSLCVLILKFSSRGKIRAVIQ